MNDFADLLVIANLTKLDTNPDFLYSIALDSTTEKELKSCLIKNKNFFFKYLVTKDSFTPTHLYQLYLQYIPYELSEVEKSIILDGYIKMITDLKGSIVSNQKRLLLEEKLHLNID